MKNKLGLLATAFFSASLLAPIGAFAASIRIDESNFQVPTNQVLGGEWNTLGVRALGFDPSSTNFTIINETSNTLGIIDIRAQWAAANPLGNGVVQSFNFNFYDPTNQGGAISDTLSIVLSGQQADPSNMSIDLHFRSDNLAEDGLTPIAGAINITEDGTFQSVGSYLPAQLLLDVSIRSDIPEPSSLALLALGALSLLPCASRKRRLAA